MNPELDFKSFLNEKLKANGLTLKKLSDLSGIPYQHLENLSLGAVKELPPAPYLRGYLRILGRVLDFEPEVWVQQFEEAPAIRKAGRRDPLPTNRFALRSSAKYLWFIAIGLVVLAYAGFRFSEILGRPTITVEAPRETAVKVGESLFTLAGRTRNATELTVNGEPVVLGGDGTWTKDIQLQPGLNSVEFRARKFLGGETTAVRQIVYEPLPAAPAPPPAGGEPAAATGTATSTSP